MQSGPLDKSLNRFFVNPEYIDKAAKSARVVDLQQIKQIRHVLRLGKGDNVVLLDGKGLAARASIRSITDKEITLDIVEFVDGISKTMIKVAVALPLLRGGRFDWALEKLTELGVDSIIPIISERSVVKAKSETGGDKNSRWQTICREAAEQCERFVVPIVHPVILLQDLLLQDLLKNPLKDLVAPSAVNAKFFCAERSNAVLLSRVLTKLKNDQQISDAWPMNILIVVGPEGGFTDSEIAKADQLGFQMVSLGPRILRSETAGVYALAQAITIFGDRENHLED